MTPLQTTQTIRFALGVGAAVGIVYGLETPLGFLSSVLVASLLGSPLPRPGTEALLGMLAAIAGAFALGVGLSLVVLVGPSIYYLSLFLLLYRIFLATARGAPAFAMLMLLLGVVLIPALGATSPDLAIDFAGDFFVAAVIAVVILAVMHGLLPDPKGPETGPGAAASAPHSATDPSAAHFYALARASALLPLLVFVVSFQQTDQLTTLLYAALLIQAPAPEGGRAAGRGMLVGTLLGGAAALVIQLASQVVFSLATLVLCVTAATAVFGRGIFGGGRRAGDFARAPSAMLILVDAAHSMVGDETEAKLAVRIAAIVLASLYVAVAFRVIGGRGLAAASRASSYPDR